MIIWSRELKFILVADISWKNGLAHTLNIPLKGSCIPVVKTCVNESKRQTTEQRH